MLAVTVGTHAQFNRLAAMNRRGHLFVCPPMNACTLTEGKVLAGICLNQSGMIEVGEQGRGRQLVTVAPPPGASIEGGRMVAVTGPRVAILFRDHSGYRGDWILRLRRKPERAELRSKLLASSREELAALGIEAASLGMEYIRERMVPQYVRKHFPDIEGAEAIASVGGKLVAEGLKAQGAAGAMGGGPEYLALLPPSCELMVSRAGRLYGAPALLVVRVSAQGEVTVADAASETATQAAASAWGG